MSVCESNIVDDSVSLQAFPVQAWQITVWESFSAEPLNLRLATARKANRIVEVELENYFASHEQQQQQRTLISLCSGTSQIGFSYPTQLLSSTYPHPSIFTTLSLPDPKYF